MIKDVRQSRRSRGEIFTIRFCNMNLIVELTTIDLQILGKKCAELKRIFYTRFNL